MGGALRCSAVATQSLFFSVFCVYPSLLSVRVLFPPLSLSTFFVYACLSVCLFLAVLSCLPVCLCCLSLAVFRCPCLHMPVARFVDLSSSLFPCLPLSLCLPTPLFFSLSISLLALSLSVAVCLSVLSVSNVYLSLPIFIPCVHGCRPDRSTDRPTVLPINKPIYIRINQPIYGPVVRSTDRPTYQQSNK